MHNNKSNMTFEELGIRDDLLRGISELGFENPMPVQEKVIPRLLDGNHDLVGSPRPAPAKQRPSACR